MSNHYVLAELSGIRDLLIVSAAWKPAFKKSLDMYPNLAVDFIEYQIGENMDEKYPCGACGRRGKRRATKELTFSVSFLVFVHRSRLTFLGCRDLDTIR